MSTTGKVIIVIGILVFLGTAGLIYYKIGLGTSLKKDAINHSTPPPFVDPNIKPSLNEAGQDALADAQQLAAGYIGSLFNKAPQQVPGSDT